MLMKGSLLKGTLPGVGDTEIAATRSTEAPPVALATRKIPGFHLRRLLYCRVELGVDRPLLTRRALSMTVRHFHRVHRVRAESLAAHRDTDSLSRHPNRYPCVSSGFFRSRPKW
jgi:hypothetical protein